MQRPLILIDFDGVFNAIGVSIEDARNVWDDIQIYEIFTNKEGFSGSKNAKISPTIINFFTRLHESDNVDIEWLTSWKEDAVFFAKSLGIPNFVWHDEPLHYSQGTWWKFEVIKNLARLRNEARPILWIDDEINNEPELGVLLSHHANIETISTKTYKGITPLQKKEISAFVERHTGVKID